MPLVVVQSLSHVQLFVTLWTVTLQIPLSMGFPKQEYWGRLLFPPPGDFLNPGIKPTSPALAGRFLPLNHQPWRELEIIQHRKHREVTDE